MRCFIAIDLPKEVKKELSNIQDRLPEAKMTLVKSENIHLTLKFLGDLNEDQVAKVKSSLNKLKFKKFKAKIKNIGVFPEPAFIRVIWAGIDPKKDLEELHATIDCMLEEEGFEKDFGFETHVTLARVKVIENKPAFIKKLNEIKINPIEFSVKGLAFRKSTLTGEGPIYEDLLKIEFN